MLRELKYLKSMIYNTPLMLTEEKAHIIAEVIDAGEYHRSISAQAGQSDTDGDDTPDITPTQSVAVIPIVGVLTHRKIPLHALSGGPLAYDTIREQFQAALDDPAITTIILDIDSEGGSVSGLFDLADYIYDARNKKEIIAVINECAASAAYALASAASKVYAPRTAMQGSIGVVAMLRDEREKDKKEGISYTFVTAGSGKNALNPHIELSEEGVKGLQEKVNEAYTLFVNTVARNRHMQVEDVLNMGAAIYTARAAVKNGLIDKVMSVDKVLQSIMGGTNTMEVSTQNNTPLPTATAQQIVEPVQTVQPTLIDQPPEIPNALDVVSAAAMHAEIEKAVASAIDANHKRIVAMLNAAKLAGVNDPLGILIDAIEGGVSVDAFSAQLVDVLRTQSELTRVVPGVSGMVTEDVLVRNAEKRRGGDKK